MKKAFSLLLMLFIALPTFVGAQIDLSEYPNFNPGMNLDVFSELAEPNLEIELDPKYPNPNQEVKATLVGDIFGATISWFINGESVEDIGNQRSISFDSGPAGESTSVSVSVVRPSGLTIEAVETITPMYLDIIIEPQTHVPSFYAGRPMLSVESMVNATAIVSGKNILNSDLVYRWQAGSEVIGGGPLRGQNKVSFSAGRSGNNLLTLAVSDLGGDVLAERSLFLPVVYPKLLFYEYHPLLGLSQKPINNTLNVIGETVTVRAEPYFLDSRVFNNPDIAEWKVSNRVYNNPSNNPYDITLEGGDTAGKAKLEFHVRDRKEVLQGVEESVYINISE